MLALMMLSSFAALLFIYIFMPALWLSIMAVDETLDAHEAGLAVVASSRYFSAFSPCTRLPLPQEIPSEKAVPQQIWLN